MLIRSRMGTSVDGFVASIDGMPALLSMPGFVPGVSHGYLEFVADCDAVLMGRSTFLPALGAPQWPWPDLEVFVITSRPLPSGTPTDVITVSDPAAATERLHSRDGGRDVHVVGGPLTIRGLLEAGGLDRLEVVVLPLVLGEGIPLSPPGSPIRHLQLIGAPRAYPDGSVELAYDTRVNSKGAS
ncbi:MAG: dihydrofolate reductase family protein [Acidimicrobiales bacterium]